MPWKTLSLSRVMLTFSVLTCGRSTEESSRPLSHSLYVQSLSLSLLHHHRKICQKKASNISSIPTSVPSSALGNMTQKIVMKVHMNCQKCRTKAMKIAARTHGVISVAVEGDSKDKVVVTGDGIDPVDLAKDMRKKVGRTSILSVEEVKAKEEKKEEKKEPKIEYYYHQYSQPIICASGYAYDDNPSCSIM